MKNLNFVDLSVSKKELLSELSSLFTLEKAESVELFDSIIIDRDFTLQEAEEFKKWIRAFFYRENIIFFTDVLFADYSNLDNIFCADRLYEERMKRIPLFFKGLGADILGEGETFVTLFFPYSCYTWKRIQEFCAQNEAFAKTNQCIPAKIQEKIDLSLNDSVQYQAPIFFCNYLSAKIESASNENNHALMREISRLFKISTYKTKTNEYNHIMSLIPSLSYISNDKTRKNLEENAIKQIDLCQSFARKVDTDRLDPYTAFAIEIMRNDTHYYYDNSVIADNDINILIKIQQQMQDTNGFAIVIEEAHNVKLFPGRYRYEKVNCDGKYDNLFYYLFLMKARGGENPLMPLEEFMIKYVPPEMFELILSFTPLQKQNEDTYQRMIIDYPGLSRYDALLERLLPCFFTIIMRDTDIWQSVGFCFFHRPWSLSLYIFDNLCEMQKTKPELIELIFAITEFMIDSRSISHSDWDWDSTTTEADNRLRRSEVCEILKKYPQVRKQLLKFCYNIIKDWDTPKKFTRGISAALNVLGTYKGVWYGLKPRLIVFRNFRGKLLGRSLVCNPHHDFLEMRSYLSLFSESLKELRQDMANTLSDWLKPLPKSKRGDLDKRLAGYSEIERKREGFEITYTEPDPVWRYAYIRAIGDLGVDVDGKGHYIHSILDKVAENDPSSMIREAAAKTSVELKNLRDGWDGDKHLRKITLAFWWFKQASRLALDLPINRKGALQERVHIEYEAERWAREEDRRREEDKRWIKAKSGKTLEEILEEAKSGKDLTEILAELNSTITLGEIDELFEELKGGKTVEEMLEEVWRECDKENKEVEAREKLMRARLKI